MPLQLQDFVPPHLFRIDNTGHLELFINEVLQPVLDLLWDEHLRWRDQADIDKANSESVNAQLSDLGNPFSVALGQPLNRRRLLARVLVEAYKTKGTVPGLVDVVRALTGIEVINVVFPATISSWVLGQDVIGCSPSDPPLPDPLNTDRAILGSSPSFVRYSFQIEVDRILTPDESEIVTEIVKLMKPAHTHFAGFLEPAIGVTVDHWELGRSVLHSTGEPVVGDEILLHE